MKRPRNIGLVLLAICGTAVVWIIWPKEREPSYRGRKLSDWVSLYSLHPQDQEAGEAVRQIGTNALPSLLQWIQYEQPGWRARIVDWLDQRPWVARDNLLHKLVEGPGGTRPSWAIWGFEALGGKALPAVADLARIMHDSKSGVARMNAQSVLVRMPGDTVLILAEGLTDKSAETRASVAAYLSDRRAQFPNESFVYPAPAVPVLVRALNDEDPRVVVAAAISLGRLAVRVDLSVPALTNKLSSQTEEVRIAAACALGGFQGQAQAAVPFLLRALTDESVAVRAAVTNALYAVAPEVLTAQVQR